MTIVNLNELYSKYYISMWKKEGLPLITERPPTTTQEMLEEFFRDRKNNKRLGKKKAIALRIKEERKRASKLDWRDFIKEEYK